MSAGSEQPNITFLKSTKEITEREREAQMESSTSFSRILGEQERQRL